jgi:hypothetical protein
MSIHDTERTKLKVVEWNAATSAGILVDQAGEKYLISKQQLDPSFALAPPRMGEILEGTIVGPGQVSHIVDPKTERINFDSVGVYPDGDVVASELGKRLEGGRPQQFGAPHDGKCLPGRERP